MKIAIYSVLNISNGAGFERWIEQIAPRLKNLGHEIIVITSKYGARNDVTIKTGLLEAGVKIYEFRTHRLIPVKIPGLFAFQDLVNILSDMDILYFNNAFAINEIITYLLKMNSKVKIISGHHGTFPEVGNIGRRLYHRIVNKRMNKWYDGHHVLNQEREDILAHWGYKNIYKIPYGVDTTSLRPGRKDDIFTVMFVGMFLHQKGLDRFADAIESINTGRNTNNNNNSNDTKKSTFDIRFLIFGSGPLSHIATSLSGKYKNVKYVGYAYPDKLAEAYMKSHVFVCPSRFEEFGLVNLEAQAAGTPVIASDIPGPREIVKDEITGFLVDASQVQEISKPIYFLEDLWYRRREEYEKYCLRARENSLGYDWDIVAKRIESMLIDIANQ